MAANQQLPGVARSKAQLKTAKARSKYAAERKKREKYERSLGDLTLRKRSRTPAAGEITITSADGSVRIEPALTPREVRKITKERLPITQGTRTAILRRDKGLCRYCGTPQGPHEIDHVLPVAKGGTNDRENLVTACRPCNIKKGTSIWKPKPIGFYMRP